MKKLQTTPVLPFVTVCIWGSLYIASGIVLKEIPALLLLFLRFFVSSLLLFAIGGRKFVKIKKEDLKELFIIGFGGYYLSNAALMLGIQYSSSSFSSLVNSMNPVLISAFAFFMLKEELTHKDIISIIISVIGAIIIIGSPSQAPSAFGSFCCVFSLIVWSYVTIHIRKMTSRYPALEVTCLGMGIAAVFSLPTVLVFLKVSHTTVHFSNSLVLPIAYICIICTALSHYMWNASLGIFGASRCASFYPVQPVVSVLLGILFLNETVSWSFLAGMACIMVSIVIHNHKQAPAKGVKRLVLPRRKAA